MPAAAASFFFYSQTNSASHPVLLLLSSTESRKRGMTRELSCCKRYLSREAFMLPEEEQEIFHLLPVR